MSQKEVFRKREALSRRVKKRLMTIFDIRKVKNESPSQNGKKGEGEGGELPAKLLPEADPSETEERRKDEGGSEN